MKQQRPAKFRSVSLSFLPVFVGAMLAGSVASDAAVLASWDVWGTSASSVFSADSTTSGFTATIAGSTGTYTSGGNTTGDFGADVTGASNSDTNSLRVVGTPATTLTLTLTNGTDSAYIIDSLHFDFGVRAQGPDSFVATYASGGLGVAGEEIGSATGLARSPLVSAAVGRVHEFDFTLSPALSDTTLGVGESATFTMAFSGGGGNTSTGNFDNIAFVGTVVPEPSSIALIGLGGLALFFRRRR